MLQNHATLIGIRRHLQKELSKIYPAGETNAIITLIMEHCGFPSPEPLLNPQHVPGVSIIAQINEIVTEIHTRRPIQYILGKTSFCDLTISVNENVLIPRPETEEMVYQIFKKTRLPPTRILDLGTGSGCIALALKKQFPESHVSALEKDKESLKIALINGIDNQLDVEFIPGDMLDRKSLLPLGKFDLIVSNPPYVLRGEKRLMDRNVLEYEPHTALFVEDEKPLLFYSAIAQQTPSILSKGGIVWLEINERFGKEVARLMTESGFTQINIHKDIHEKERFIEARI